VEIASRRRLRSTSVQLGALTALALTLSGCNLGGDDDDDCALGGGDGGDRVVAVAMRGPDDPAAGSANRQRSPESSAVVPERGGFGTHLASCGG
jgi:hypothetical protein